MSSSLRFVDVFAGCGGLSLGLMQAGCQGIFAIERNPLAFDTFRHNLIDGKHYQFNWPTWLPTKAMSIEDLLKNHADSLEKLKGTVDVLVGGPPCQGFSVAGKRDPDDPRNKMIDQYFLLIEKLAPRFLVIENVSGFAMKFEANDQPECEPSNKRKNVSYAEDVARKLEEHGYHVSRGLVNCADYGVPQNRFRYLFLCEKKDSESFDGTNLIDRLEDSRESFLEKKKLPNRKIVVKEAIGDLETKNKKLVQNTDSGRGGYEEISYKELMPSQLNEYLNLMRCLADSEAPNSLRLVNHREKTIEHFKKVQETCRPGFSMSEAEQKELGTKKHSITVLHPDRPSATITTLPDDILHYDEPRVLTVREHARIQSFPDWFSFQGKYTTGGKKRVEECPRYTQVGNAVPPLLANAIGKVLIRRAFGHDTEDIQ